MAPTEPLRQYPHEDLPQATRHEVEGDTATDTYHIPGRPLPEDVSESPAVDANAPLLPHNEDPVWATGVDTRHIDTAYATKDNIVRAPEDVPTATPPSEPAHVDAVEREPVEAEPADEE
jgi:hypothetical protein